MMVWWYMIVVVHAYTYIHLWGYFGEDNGINEIKNNLNEECDDN